MKYTGIFAMLLASAAMLTSCSDDEPIPGNPVMNVTGELEAAHFGDNLKFTIKATDAEVPSPPSMPSSISAMRWWRRK